MGRATPARRVEGEGGPALPDAQPTHGAAYGQLAPPQPRTFSQQTRQEPVSAGSPVPASTLAAPMAGWLAIHLYERRKRALHSLHRVWWSSAKEEQGVRQLEHTPVRRRRWRGRPGRPAAAVPPDVADPPGGRPAPWKLMVRAWGSGVTPRPAGLGGRGSGRADPCHDTRGCSLDWQFAGARTQQAPPKTLLGD